MKPAASGFDSGELAQVDYCGASSDYRSCALEAGHTGMHGAPIAGDVRHSWTWWAAAEVYLDPDDVVYKSPPWAKHTFPHRKITFKLVRASSRPYRCSRVIGTPAGHSPVIAPGDSYLRVSLKPESGSAGWRSRELCIPCALAYGLATTTPPPPPKVKP